MVARGAEVVVVAGGIVQNVGATAYGVTGLGGANVIVIAEDDSLIEALAINAVIATSAEVAVVASALGGSVKTAGGWHARIGGAGACIITIYRLPGFADSILAEVSGGADVTIFAALVIGYVRASTGSFTAIISAGVAIIAINRLPTLA